MVLEMKKQKQMDSEHNDSIQWISREDIVTKRDERLALQVYRIIKIYWQFLLGLIIGFLLGAGVFK